MKVLVVDTDDIFVRDLAAALEREGYHVDQARTGDEALALIGRLPYGLVLVEWLTPGGGDFLRRYRDVDPLLTAVVVTAYPSQETAIQYLRGAAEARAADYLIKPSPDLVRRLVHVVDTHLVRLTAGDFELNLKTRRATFDGQPLDLHAIEMAILRVFMKQPHQAITYEELSTALGRPLPQRRAVNNLRASVSRLRKKLDTAAGRPVIRSVRHHGMSFYPATAGASSYAGEIEVAPA